MKKNIFFFCITLCLFTSCIKNSDYIINQGLAPDNLIKITSITPATALADSSTQITIRVSINNTTDSAKSVTLTTSAGIINGKSNSETMSVNLNRYADFVLRTGQVAGIISLRASVLTTFYRDTTISLGVAYPDTLILKPDSYSMTKGSTLNVGINLLRYSGFPSNNQTILLSSLDSAGNNIGQFNYAGTYSPGSLLTGTFSAPSNFAGKATLQIVLVKKDGTKMSNKSIITIQ